jgi:hypothetical protein
MSDLQTCTPDEPKLAKLRPIHLRHGLHSFEVRPIRSGGSLSYVGFYDDRVSVIAHEPHVALQMLLRRHVRTRRGSGA